MEEYHCSRFLDDTNMHVNCEYTNNFMYTDSNEDNIYTSIATYFEICELFISIYFLFWDVNGFMISDTY